MINGFATTEELAGKAAAMGTLYICNTKPLQNNTPIFVCHTKEKMLLLGYGICFFHSIRRKFEVFC